MWSNTYSSASSYDLQALGLDFLELLTRFLPTEYERSLIARFEREQRPLEELSEEDRFMLRFCRIPRLPERMTTLTFLGNFPDTVQLLMPVWAGQAGQCGCGLGWGWGGGLSQPGLQESIPECLRASYGFASTLPQLTLPSLFHLQQLNAIIAASMSIKSSDKLRQILEVGQGSGR